MDTTRYGIGDNELGETYSNMNDAIGQAIFLGYKCVFVQKSDGSTRYIDITSNYNMQNMAGLNPDTLPH